MEIRNSHPLLGLVLAQASEVPGTQEILEHHVWHPQILRLLVLNGTNWDFFQEQNTPADSNSNTCSVLYEIQMKHID